MKRSVAFPLLAFSFFLFSCDNVAEKSQGDATEVTSEKPADGKLPKVEFVNGQSHDFGKINEGEAAQHTFEIKNVGEGPLVLERVKPSCGCTAPAWTKDPIAPGSIGKVSIEFDTKGKEGAQSKNVTVFAKYIDPFELKFTAEVVKSK